MIRSLFHARKVQARRAMARKAGYAKAVLRYLKREHRNEFRILKDTLPVFIATKSRAPEKKHEAMDDKASKFRFSGG